MFAFPCLQDDAWAFFSLCSHITCSSPSHSNLPLPPTPTLLRVSCPGWLGLPLCCKFLAPAGSVSHCAASFWPWLARSPTVLRISGPGSARLGPKAFKSQREVLVCRDALAVCCSFLFSAIRIRTYRRNASALSGPCTYRYMYLYIIYLYIYIYTYIYIYI